MASPTLGPERRLRPADPSAYKEVTMAISTAPTAQASPRLIAGLGLIAMIAIVAAALVAQARPGTAFETGTYRLSDTTMLMQQVRAAP